MSEENEWNEDTTCETLWEAIDQLRQRRQTLVNGKRQEKINYNERIEMFARQMGTNPAMRANADQQLKMMKQQKMFSKQNFYRETDAIDVKINTIERILDKQRHRDIKILQSNDATSLKEDGKRLSLQLGELRSEVNIMRGAFTKQFNELRETIASLQK